MQLLDDRRQHRRDRAAADGRSQHRTIDLHDVGLQPADPLDVGCAGAEIVDRDVHAGVAIGRHGFAQQRLVAAFGLEDLDADAPGREAVVADELGELARAARIADRRLRIDVHEEHAIARVDHREIAQVQRAADPIEEKLVLRRRAAEDAFDRDDLAVRVGRAHEALEADAEGLAHAVDGLEARRQAHVAPLHRPAAACTQQPLGRPRQRAARNPRVRAARFRRARVDPLPHEPGPGGAGLTPASGHCARRGLPRGYPSLHPLLQL